MDTCSGLRMRQTELSAAGPSNSPIDTHTRTMFGLLTRNSS